MLLNEGDFLKVIGFKVKNDNDIFVVKHRYEHGEYCLYKVTTTGEESKVKYNIVFLKEKHFNDPALTIEVVTKDDLKQAKKEVNDYLKGITQIEKVYSFNEIGGQEVIKGSYIKVIKSIPLTSSIYSVPKVYYECTHTSDKGYTFHMLGKRGEKLSTYNASATNKILLHFTDKLVKQLFNENYIVMAERIEQTKGEIEQDENKTTSEQQEQIGEGTVLNYQYTITPDTDTRDNSNIWIVKITDKLSKEEYKNVSDEFKKIEGYYSRFKHGFLFKYDPSEVLKGNNNNEETQQKNDQEQPNEISQVAECIIDKSTKIITNLELTNETYPTNKDYKKAIAEYLQNNNIEITESIIDYIKKDFSRLAEILQTINKEQQEENNPYKQPDIEDGFIYDAHFKAWDIDIKTIQEQITALNIDWIDWGEKIGFKGLTADQARQTKEISDNNSSIFFIDEKKYIENNGEEPEQEEIMNNDILSKFDNIEVNNNTKISEEDKNFCEEQEKMYNEFIKFSDDYLEYLNNNSVSNIFFNSQSLIASMNETRNYKKDMFISKIVNYFADKYKVTLEYESIQQKYDITIQHNTIVDEIIEQLGGYDFRDKAEKELKDEFKNCLKYDKVKVKNNKISIDSFFYIDSWDLKYKEYSVSYNSDEKFYKLFKVMSHFMYRSYESYFNEIYDIITRQKNDSVFTTHNIANNGILTLKLFKNGRIDLEFSTNEYAQKFAKEYCGVMAQAA